MFLSRGDKINDNQLQIGNNLKIDFDIERREYNNKWYTDIKAWEVRIASATSQNNSTAPIENNSDFHSSEDCVLPF